MNIHLIRPAIPPFLPETVRTALTAKEDEAHTKGAFVVPLLHQVAENFQQLLLQNALFIGKLANLTVELRLHTGENGWTTFGEYSHRMENGRPVGSIHLDVNISNSPKSIGFVFAHELSHMLMDMQMDCCRCFDASESGIHPGASLVNRQLGDSCEEMGAALEESIADTLAMYVVSRCGLSDAEGTYASDIQETHPYFHLRSFAPLLAAAFGDPLEDCQYIDEFSSTPLPPAEPGVTDRGITMEAAEFVQAHVRNPFWYGLVVGRMHHVIDEYEDHMGAGSWKTLCRHMDTLLITHLYHEGNYSPEDLEHKAQAEALLLEFGRKMKEAPQTEKPEQ